MSMKKETLMTLLSAEDNRATALTMMQLGINESDFDYAMESQFEYLYWVDECNRLHKRFNSEYWDLRFMATGEPT